jgi:hypothetical protein
MLEPTAKPASGGGASGSGMAQAATPVRAARPVTPAPWVPVLRGPLDGKTFVQHVPTSLPECAGPPPLQPPPSRQPPEPLRCLGTSELGTVSRSICGKAPLAPRAPGTPRAAGYAKAPGALGGGRRRHPPRWFRARSSTGAGVTHHCDACDSRASARPPPARSASQPTRPPHQPHASQPVGICREFSRKCYGLG